MRWFFLLLWVMIAFCASLPASLPVLVSIPPQKFLTERIGGEHIAVTLLVPAGASPHSYEPTARQVLSARRCAVWFRIGEGFENRLVDLLSQPSQGEGRMTIIDQREGIPLLPLSAACHCQADAYDPHIWLSPPLLLRQAAQIKNTLCALLPDHAGDFTARYDQLAAELLALDTELQNLLAPYAGATLLTSHPAFGYFCHTYHLEQLSLEMEGKEPSARQITHILQKAHDAAVKTVLIQEQYNPKAGERVAHALGLRSLSVDPYAEAICDTLRQVASALTENGE